MNKLSRRQLFGSVAGLGFAALFPQSATAGGKLQLIYISAGNCPHCAAFYYDGFSEMKALAARHGIAVRVIDVPKFQFYGDTAFPSDLEWLKAAGYQHGTPKFLLISGNTIIEHAGKAKAYQKKIVPLIERA